MGKAFGIWSITRDFQLPRRYLLWFFIRRTYIGTFWVMLKKNEGELWQQHLGWAGAPSPAFSWKDTDLWRDK